MKYNLHINQKSATELGIKNVNQAIIFDLLTSASTWSETEIIKGVVYYWVARQKIVTELPLLNLKSDTIYRHLKSLAELDLIVYIKKGKKDCIKVSEKGKKYLSEHYVGNKSEKDENSEINPTKLGNKSEYNSEINPTYNTTKDNTTKDNNYKTFLTELKRKVITPSKITYTQSGKKMFKDIKDLELFTRLYISHQKENKEFAKRITSFMEDHIARQDQNIPDPNDQSTWERVEI